MLHLPWVLREIVWLILVMQWMFTFTRNDFSNLKLFDAYLFMVNFQAAEQEKPNPGDMFDSEMFEWTQRPCSPEILPSPAKAKVKELIYSDMARCSPSLIVSSVRLKLTEKFSNYFAGTR